MYSTNNVSKVIERISIKKHTLSLSDIAMVVTVVVGRRVEVVVVPLLYGSFNLYPMSESSHRRRSGDGHWVP
jgi:hypothetical protein